MAPYLLTMGPCDFASGALPPCAIQLSLREAAQMLLSSGAKDHTSGGFIVYDFYVFFCFFGGMKWLKKM